MELPDIDYQLIPMPKKKCVPIAINDGASQYNRMLNAMRDGYVAVDERTFEDLLEFAIEFTELVYYYNLKDEIAGNWAPFFISDEAMIYASIMNMDLSKLEADYLETEKRVKQCLLPNEKFNLLQELFCQTIYPARKINLWLKGLNFISTGQSVLPLAKEINRSITESLSNELRTLRSYDEGAGLENALEQAIGLYYGDFLPVWNTKNVPPNGCIYSGRTFCAKIDHAVPYLRPIFYAFYYELASIQKSVIGDFQGALDKPDHKPQIALYFAFVKLFRNAQKSINSYTPRYRDFYYYKILRESLKKYIPDSLFLTFTLEEDDDLTYAKVEKGALFVAGQDENDQDILYAADKDLFVNKSEIKKLHTLYQHKGPLFEELATLPPLAPVSCQSPSENEKELKRIFGADILPPSFIQAEAPEEDSTQLQPQAFPTFGDNQPLDMENYKNGDALMGFAFSTEYLFLGQGKRHLSFLFKINDKSWETLMDRLEKIKAETGSTCKEIFKNLLQHSLEIFYSAEEGWEPVDKKEIKPTLVPDKKAFKVEFSLPPSAPAITNFAPESEDEADDQETLAEGAGPYSSNPDPELPTVKFYFKNPKVRFKKKNATEVLNVFPLSLFNVIEIDKVDIETKVLRLAPSWLSNNAGEIDPSAPYNPFAPVPAVGSYLSIGNDEIFQKPLDSLLLNLEWFDLPQNSDGFKGYYQYYKKGLDGKEIKPEIDNTVFKGKISVVGSGSWELKTKKEADFLFSTEKPENEWSASPPPEPDKKLYPGLTLNLDVINKTTGNPPYYSPQNSYLKLELTRPPYAFGDSIYSINVMDAVLKELEKFDERIIDSEKPIGSGTISFEGHSAGSGTISLKTPQSSSGGITFDTNSIESGTIRFKNSPSGSGGITLKYPSLPYTPTIQSLSLDYTSSWSVSFASGPISFIKDKKQENKPVFYRLYPFGGCEAVNSQISDAPPAADSGQAIELLPQFQYQGNLIIGFSNMLLPQTLTLLFQFEENRSEIFLENSPFICWSFLEKNNWQCLTPSQVLSDTTLGFQKSGIVTLNIPSFSTTENTVLPDNLHWLRASVNKDAKEYPGTINIWPQAVVATWVDNDNTGRHLMRPLPALSIDTPLEELPGVETILQPMESFNGRPKETPDKMFLRVAERLRHKNRAVLPWDYESLVLEQFPTIYKVKCMPHRSPTKPEQPGSVLVVITPGPDNQDTLDPITPKAGVNMLNDVRAYLAERTSPFIKLYVKDPVYCQIKVIATVGFTEGDDVGLSLDRLNSDLINYLSPWFYDLEREEKGGTYFFESDISYFIQTRPYVDYLESLDFTYDPELNDCKGGWFFYTSARKHELKIAGMQHECV